MQRHFSLSLIALAVAACSVPPAESPRQEAGAQSRPAVETEAKPSEVPSARPDRQLPATPERRMALEDRARVGEGRDAPVKAEPAPQEAVAPRPAVAPPQPLAAAPASKVMIGVPPPAGYIQPAPESRERYQNLKPNPVHLAAEEPVSTFSIDVDTGSYSNVRRMLTAGQLPPQDAVRVEEMINYFPYDYAGPKDGHPFAVHTELVQSPWNPHAQLLRIGIKGEDKARESLPPSNLVFLVDVSGSMHSADKLPLLKSSLKLLAERLRPQDRISLVTYASGTQVVLPATPGSDKARIVNAIDALQAGGSTAGASGIELAYRTAREGFIDGGINRILLATDGDFNVGVTDFNQLKGMVEEKRKSGIALSTLGFGTGNYNEQLMEQLADAGDGAYSYIDSLMEGHKVLVNEASSTLATIARDVKIQIEFNPAQVREYRLVGYENRLLAREDFNNDKVDAGDIGAGHTVTALYEITPAGAPGRVDPLRYGQDKADKGDARSGELAFVKLRYKQPGASDSVLITRPVPAGKGRELAQADADTRFAVAVAGFGQLLRGGQYTGSWDWSAARNLAQGARGNDPFGYRGEFLRLVDLAAALGTRAPEAGSDPRR